MAEEADGIYGEPLLLPERLDLSQARAVLAALRERLGQPVVIDAHAVEHLGTLCLQVLLSAERHWRSMGLPFRVTNRSAAFSKALVTFGIGSGGLGGGQQA